MKPKEWLSLTVLIITTKMEQQKQKATPEQLEAYKKKAMEATKYCLDNKLVTPEEAKFWISKGMSLSAIMLAKMEVHQKAKQKG